MEYRLTTFHVKDMDQAVEFLHGVMGMPLRTRYGIERGGELSILGKEGEPAVELMHYPGGDAPAPSGFTLGFHVDSLEAATAHVVAHGCALASGPIQPSPKLRFSFFDCPLGIRIQLLEEKE